MAQPVTSKGLFPTGKKSFYYGVLIIISCLIANRPVSHWVCSMVCVRYSVTTHTPPSNFDLAVCWCVFVDSSRHLVPIAVWPSFSFARIGFN